MSWQLKNESRNKKWNIKKKSQQKQQNPNAVELHSCCTYLSVLYEYWNWTKKCNELKYLYKCSLHALQAQLLISSPYDHLMRIVSYTLSYWAYCIGVCVCAQLITSSKFNCIIVLSRHSFAKAKHICYIWSVCAVCVLWKIKCTIQTNMPTKLIWVIPKTISIS